MMPIFKSIYQLKAIANFFPIDCVMNSKKNKKSACMLPFECLVLDMEPIEGEKSKMATECSSQRRLQSMAIPNIMAISKSIIQNSIEN